MDNGTTRILKERVSQIVEHDFTVIRDIKLNSDRQLTRAARKLISVSTELVNYPPKGWNKEMWAKMCNKSYSERLIIAGALIAAEYDRVNKITNF